MPRPDIRKTNLSSTGPFVVTALFCISVPHQGVTTKLSINKFTLSSDTTQWCGPELLPVGKPVTMDSHYWAVMVYRDCVRPCSRHFGTTTDLTVSPFWRSYADFSPRTACLNYTNVQIGLWHRIRFWGAVIIVFVPRFVILIIDPETCRSFIRPAPHQNLVFAPLPFWPRRKLS